MRFLDKLALNRLIAIITNFILAIIKIFKPSEGNVPPVDRGKRRRPLLDLLDKWTKK